MYALIDSNNFFVSCERLFRPDLAGVPTIVLSSNDGCAISRSDEAKALGIAMGEPVFKLRTRFEVAAGNQPLPASIRHRHARPGVVVFSANFELYGDISERITALLTSMTPRIEVYSVDESFLDLSGLGISDYAAWGRELHARILRSVGIPVSVGVAPTKTLCKLANHWAKQHRELQGAYYLGGPASGTPALAPGCAVLRQTGVDHVWGVGRRLAPKLKAEGVHTALQLSRLAPRRAAQLMGIHGRHMVYELNGVRCLPLQIVRPAQQMVCRGRQFGADTSDPRVIEAAIASLGARAARQLRHEGRLATRAAVILRTNRLKPNYRQLWIPVRLYTPTADTGTLCSQLVRAMYRQFTPGLLYHKADVLLYELVSAHGLQTDLLGSVNLAAAAKSQQRMAALDAINSRYGPGTLRYAAEGLSHAWRPRKHLASPHYTTQWSDLPEVTLRP